MITYPNYDRSILSIASSVLNHFGIKDCKHKTLSEFDKLLEKDYKNIIVMLFDGLGTSTIKYHLEENDFLRKHHVTDISSVFPSTTVAATTSIMSGYSPAECGWLGWDLYFEEIGENVAVFRNTLQRNGEPAAKFNVAHKYIPVKSIMKRIEEVNGRRSAYCVSFFSKYRSKSVEDIWFADTIKTEDGKEKIIIYGDYDVDGITSVTVLKSFLEERGLKVDEYIPNRLDEGYGLNKTAVEDMEPMMALVEIILIKSEKKCKNFSKKVLTTNILYDIMVNVSGRYNLQNIIIK